MKRSITLVLIISLLIISTFPGVSLGSEQLVLRFASSNEDTLITGVPKTVFMELYTDYYLTGVTGPVNVSLTDPNGKMSHYEVSGTQNPYVIDELTLATEGTYTLNAVDAQGNTATGYLYVEAPEVRVLTYGVLEIDSESRIKAKLVDDDGTALGKKAVTVDGTEAGANPAVQTYTTLNDGTFMFTMTPTEEGLIKFIVDGDVVNVMRVGVEKIIGDRIGGEAVDNASLSVAVSVAGWESAEAVILTRDDLVADAIVAVPLSKQLGAPILMNPTYELRNEILAEIERLNPQTVYIIGGTGAIAETVENEILNDPTLTKRDIIRFDGKNRQDTAAQIANWMGSSETVYLANAYGEPDALAASVFAARNHIPILLTDKGQLSEVTSKALTDLSSKNVVLLGGSNVISQELEDELRLNYSVERWGGKDRYETEEIIFSKHVIEEGPVYFTTALVTANDVKGGRPYGDALVASALAARNNGFVVVVPPSQAEQAFSLSQPPYRFLLLNRERISDGVIIGNQSAINSASEELLQRLLLQES